MNRKSSLIFNIQWVIPSTPCVYVYALGPKSLNLKLLRLSGVSS